MANHQSVRVAVISHTYVLRANRGKLESLTRLPGVDVLLVVPRQWRNRDIGQRFRAETQLPGPLSLSPVPAWSMGSGSLITYSPFSVWRLLHRFRPTLVHLEEEPWSFAALELSIICGMVGIPFTFFTWENTDRQLSVPFRAIRRQVLRRARAAIAGNVDAKVLLERDGFRNAVTILPQLGVDTSVFQPGEHEEGPVFVVGYVGRLVPQKGIFVLLDALARLPTNVRLLIVGNGPLKQQILGTARALGLDGRLELHDGVSHHEVPQYLRQMNVLVLPSLTTAKWKEQFGHVLVEAMSCAVPVVGSDSGGIPEVIGDAGLVVPEGSAHQLATALRRLIASPDLAADLAARGRSRALAEYANDTIAQRLAAFWQKVVRVEG